MIKLNINGFNVPCLTIAELAKMCDKKADTLRKLEQKSILPPANFRTDDVMILNGDKSGETRQGNRVYSYVLAVKVAEVVKAEIKQGVQVQHSTIVKLKELFNNEETLIEENYAKNSGK